MTLIAWSTPPPALSLYLVQGDIISRHSDGIAALNCGISVVLILEDAQPPPLVFDVFIIKELLLVFLRYALSTKAIVFAPSEVLPN